MSLNKTNQIDFSSMLFDTLFGLVLFYSFDSILDISDHVQFIFYLFTTIILIHWWLIFRSSDDAYDRDVNDSAVDVLIGVGEIILLEFVTLTSRSANYLQTCHFMIGLLLVDLLWVLIWQHVGKWHTTDSSKINKMERELRGNFKAVVIGLILFIPAALFNSMFSPAAYVAYFIGAYCIFIFCTFRFKVVDINIF